MIKKYIDVNTWKRKEHYDFFSKYDEPFWGIVSEIDCTEAYEKSKGNGFSFFLYYLHKSIIALNEIEEFTYRISDGEITVFDEIHVATTIGRPDETFGYSFIEYNNNFTKFSISADKEILRINNSTGLSLNENSKRLDVIHYSSLPWTKFTGLTHARDFKNKDSVPKIVFGKYFVVNGRKIMNVSLNAHHGFADGIHGAKFFELFQKMMNE